MPILIDVDNQYDRLCFLLNSLASTALGPAAPWRVTRAQKENTDELGVTVQRGEKHFVRRDVADRAPLRRLALPSAERLWELFIEDNDLTNRLVQQMLTEEEAELWRLGYGPSTLERWSALAQEGDATAES